VLEGRTSRSSHSTPGVAQDSADTLLSALCIGLEGLRADTSEVKVPSGRIVDVVGHIGQGEFPVLANALLDPLLLCARREGFSDGPSSFLACSYSVLDFPGFRGHLELGSCDLEDIVGSLL